MTASSTGIAGSPVQIGDGVNPDYKAQVYPDFAVKVRFGGLSVDALTGQVVGQRTDFANRVIASERAILQSILAEARLQTYLLYCLCTNQNVPEDLDALRREPSIVRETDIIELEN